MDETLVWDPGKNSDKQAVGKWFSVPQEAAARSLTCCGTWMLVSCRGDTWPGLACTLAWTSSRCGGRRKELNKSCL